MNVPSVSSINRIVRTRAQQRQKDLQEKAALGHFSILQTLPPPPHESYNGLIPSPYSHHTLSHFAGFPPRPGTGAMPPGCPGPWGPHPGLQEHPHQPPQHHHLDSSSSSGKLLTVFPAAATSTQQSATPSMPYFVYPTIPPTTGGGDSVSCHQVRKTSHL